MLFFQLVNQEYRIPSYVNFLIGGISGTIGQTVTQPMDVVKIRMQISKLSVTDAIRQALKNTGIRGLYLGLSATVLRQMTYTTTRLGIYSTLYDLGMAYFGGLNYPTMFGIGMISGVVGAFVGTPTDLVFVRMIGDMKLPPEKRQNYRNAVVALIGIAKKEGVRALWRGAVPTMTRAAIVNGTQLGTYSKSKEILLDTGMLEEGVLLSLSAGMISGLVMALASLPVDVSKTRGKNSASWLPLVYCNLIALVYRVIAMKESLVSLVNCLWVRICRRIQNWVGSTKPPGIFHMMMHIAQQEGILSLWRGFLPYYCRAAPNSVVTMVCLDYLKHLYITHFAKTD